MRYRLRCAVFASLAMWIGCSALGNPPGGPPPPTSTFAAASVSANAPPIGVAVAVRGAVVSPVVGKSYRLYCQYVLHVGKGQPGPMLVVPDSAAGSETTLVREVIASDASVTFDEVFDVTRRHLAGRSPLPVVQPGEYNQTAFIRVEPQIYDVAASKYLTQPRTPAVIVVASVGSGGRVDSVQSLGSWMLERAIAQLDPAQTIARLNDLDAFDTYDNGVDDAILQTLNSQSVPVETKVVYLDAIAPESLKLKLNYNLLTTLQTLAAGENVALKTAAQRKLDQVK